MSNNSKRLSFNRHYTERVEDYWNREYLDYSPRLDNIIEEQKVKSVR